MKKAAQKLNAGRVRLALYVSVFVFVLVGLQAHKGDQFRQENWKGPIAQVRCNVLERDFLWGGFGFGFVVSSANLF